ncbi:hypothetical protein [Streptomyces sp. NPDC018045]|uniref:hypothetical protein n=1 Tax=Streptomyces sp. NPDC018045 TaxID=3365037 RepID=UPI0037BAAF35
MPGLLGDAHVAARSRQEMDLARLSTGYSLLSQVLSKIGSYERANRAADRAIVYADLSGSSLAAAAAAREMSIVLRHQDQPAKAQRLILKAAAQVEATSLTTGAQTSAYAQMLCTQAYCAARAGDRTQALATIGEAQRAARFLPEQAPRERVFPLTPAAASPCMPSASSGPSATPAPPWKPVRTCGNSSSLRLSARRGCTPTWRAPGGRCPSPSRPPTRCCTPYGPCAAKSTTGPPSARSSPTWPSATHAQPESVS